MLLKLQLFATLSLIAHDANALSLGRVGITLTTASLKDYTRLDPFSPSPQAREVVISTFSPAANNCTCFIEVPYMPPATARFESHKLSASYGLPEDLFTNLTLSTASPSCHNSTSAASHAGQPTIVFSPALGTTRHFYNLLAATLAASGHRVVTIDHPYDADIVEFPNGTLVHGLDLNDTQLPLAVQTRAQDIRFVVDSLASHARPHGSSRGLPAALAVGHSLGGAAAVVAAAGGSRLRGAANLDGSVPGGLPNHGRSAGAAVAPEPVLFVAHEGKNLTTDETWAAVWPRLGGVKSLLALRGSQHYTFSDFPALVAGLGLDVTGSDAIQAMVGSIPGNEAMATVVGVLDTFSRLAAGVIGPEEFAAAAREYDQIQVVLGP
ncbi:hypothetical protein B0J12DRAFT_600349 [Macrophomina phaseolina]|uniref:1-alkyl-2-acetylglycerophosphocholine esterase n=1 Tax=Macrophomina phaseolina TaxID=35725 RepID=A0ABQ8GB81_9PEZI|nr:hypothetical protein B0J12DRAFT_600349 [Macrophomina phaseolina]